MDATEVGLGYVFFGGGGVLRACVGVGCGMLRYVQGGHNVDLEACSERVFGLYKGRFRLN